MTNPTKKPFSLSSFFQNCRKKENLGGEDAAAAATAALAALAAAAATAAAAREPRVPLDEESR